jgi:hypothetical protein
VRVEGANMEFKFAGLKKDVRPSELFDVSIDVKAP